MTFGLTPQGWNAKRLADILIDLDNAILAQYGEANLEPQSVFGQIIGVMAKAYADIWDNMAAVYYSEYPNSATGVSLDNVVSLNGISRLPATQTQVYGICSGTEGTFIPRLSLASIPTTNQVFQSINPATISASTAYSVLIYVDSLTTNAYTVQINGQNFVYSLPIITFTGNFVSSNSIVVTLNGTELAAVAFNTDNDTTLSDIATQIATDPSVFSATPIGSHVIDIVANLGFQVVINDIQITGGISQPTWVITYAAPATIADVVNGLISVINALPLSQPVTASNSSSDLLIVANTITIPFNASVGTNLSLYVRSTAILFVSQQYGPVPCPANTLTNILTPISGWTAINNPFDGVLGTNVETDAALRLRRLKSISITGNATVEAIRAHLLALPGVTAALVFENSTTTQDEIDITLSVDLITGNSVSIVFNGVTLPPVVYATSNLATMTQIAQLLAAQPESASCVVAGVGNHILQLNMKVLEQVIIETFTITGGASQPVVTISGGRPAKSFEAVVQGGTTDAIGETIWLSKPAGIETFGNTEVNITDSQGETQAIFYSVPTPVYIWIEVALTLYPEETFPVDGVQLVAQSILDYGNSLGIGVDVLLQRVNCQIFNVSGIASGAMEMAATSSPDISPVFSTNDIPIAEASISVWDITRINVTVV